MIAAHSEAPPCVRSHQPRHRQRHGLLLADQTQSTFPSAGQYVAVLGRGMDPATLRAVRLSNAEIQELRSRRWPTAFHRVSLHFTRRPRRRRRRHVDDAEITRPSSRMASDYHDDYAACAPYATLGVDFTPYETAELVARLPLAFNVIDWVGCRFTTDVAGSTKATGRVPATMTRAVEWRDGGAT